MNLRTQRTESAIKEAFLRLRQTKPIEKISVTELSKLAGINKATFYLHYADIYTLSDEIEDGMIDEILPDLGVVKKYQNQPQIFSTEILRRFIENRSRLNTAFSGSRYSLFAQKIEQRLKKLIYEQYPDVNTRENDILLTFLIQGVFHTVAACREEDSDDAYVIISRLTSDIYAKIIEYKADK